MQIHEQIYTSASELLEPGQSGLGVVAESAGFPRKVASQLGSLASYRLLDDKPVDDPGSHPARIIAMPRENGQSYCISRIVFAGADHTGRTTPLAHHVLFANEGLVGDGVKLPDVVRTLRRHFADRWEQSPTRFDPPRSLNVGLSRRALQPIGAASPQRLASILGWLASCSEDWMDPSRQPVVFVMPTDQRDASLDLLALICSVIPNGKQIALIFQSHVVLHNDLIGHASVVTTYPQSEYLNEMRGRPDKRRPKMIDLTDESAEPIGNVGFANWFERQLLSDAPAKTLQDGLVLRRSLGDIDEGKFPDGFAKLWAFFHTLKSGHCFSCPDEIAEQLKTLSGMSPSAENVVSKWTSGAIKNHVEQNKETSDWQGLVKVLSNASWPAPARNLCLAAVTRMPEYSFPFVLANEEAKKMPALLKQLDETLESNSNLWGKLLRGSPQPAVQCRRFLERRLVSGKLPPQAGQRLTEILLKTGDASQQRQAARLFLTSPNQPQTMLPKAFQWLQSIVAKDGWLQDLHDGGDLPVPVASALRAYLQPSAPMPPPAPASEPAPPNTADSARASADAFAVPSRADGVGTIAVGRPASFGTGPRQISNPKPAIKIIAIGAGVITALGTAAIGVGHFRNMPKLSSHLSMLAVGSAVLCLLVAMVAYFWFGKNRNIKLRYPLMVFGFFTVFLMIMSAIAILYSFATPFLIGAASDA